MSLRILTPRRIGALLLLHPVGGVLAQDGAKVNISGIGALPIWLVVILVIIIISLCIGFGYLLWRRHHGNPAEDIEAVPRASRFRESGNWKKRFSRVMKEQEPSGVFREGTILGQLEAGRGEGSTTRKGSVKRKAGEPLVDLGEGGVERSQSRKASGTLSAKKKASGDVLRRITSSSSRSKNRKETVENDSASAARSSGDTLNDEDVLSAVKASGHGDLGLGSGFSALPLGSVIKIEEDTVEYPTIRSTRSIHSNTSAADDRSQRQSLSRSGTIKSNVSRSSVNRSASQRHRDRDNATSSSQRETGTYLNLPSTSEGLLADIPPPPGYIAVLDPKGESVGRSRSRSERRERSPTRSRSRRTKTHLDVEDAEKEDDRDREREVQQERSRKRHVSRSRTRDASTRRQRSTVPSDTDDSDSNIPLGQTIARQKSTRENLQRSASSNAAKRHASRKSNTGSSRKLTSHASTGVLSSGKGERVDDGDRDDETPLASVVLQALQQNMASGSKS